MTSLNSGSTPILRRPSSSPEQNVIEVFERLTDNGEYLNKEQFCRALIQELSLNLSRKEAERLFLQQADKNGDGVVNIDVFVRAVRDNVFLTRIVSSLAHKRCFEVHSEYDCTKSTASAYTHTKYIIENEWGTSASKDYQQSKHGGLYGDFVSIRKTLDYSWHPNYTEQRQLWQDQIVKDVAQRHAPVRWPWLVLTCGAMGAGKGYCLRWLSRTGIFPLDNVVKIDPDHFKSVMPEWKRYTEYDKTNEIISAGNNTHKESGFIQELCQTVSLQLRQNTWIDGSLQDHEWWSEWIGGTRQKYPWYRIAIFYVHAQENQVLDRAYQRGLVTGRFIEKEKLLSSIQKTKIAIEKLGPLADFVARIDNSGKLPSLDVFEDRSRSFRAISDRFRGKSARDMRFPESLGTMWLRPISPQLFLSNSPIDENSWKELTNPAGLARIDVISMFLLDVLVDTTETETKQEETSVLLNNSSLSSTCSESFITAEDLYQLKNILPETAQLWVSRTHPTTLDDHSRSIAGIPNNADIFCWTHGLVNKDVRMTILNSFDNNRQPLLHLMLYGGYLYFESAAKSLVAVNAVCPHPGNHLETQGMNEIGWTFRLEFESAQLLPKDFEKKKLQSNSTTGSRWVECMNPALTAEGVLNTAWLLPGELATCPMGGFAFQMKKDGKKDASLASHDIYFAVDAS
jgi:hypothetical protein